MSGSLNQVSLIGGLGRDPEVRTMSDGVIRLGIAEIAAQMSSFEEWCAATQWKCPRCGEVMQDKDEAEGCEDLACPAIGGEQ